jgi:hypothetical protein
VHVLVMTRLFWLTLAPILAVILLFRDGTRADGLWPSIRTRVREAARDPSLAALVSLACMPVVLMIISVVLQPSMVTRYGLVAVLAWAPLVGLAADTLGRGARAAVVLLLAFVAYGSFAATIAQQRTYADQMRANQTAFERAKSMNVPVVFQKQHLIFPLAGPQRSPGMLARYLVVPDSTLMALYPSDRFAWLRRQFQVERDQSRLHEKLYGFPILATRAALDTTPMFLVFATDFQIRGGWRQAELWGSIVFPHHRVRRLDDFVTLFERTTPATASATTSPAAAR